MFRYLLKRLLTALLLIWGVMSLTFLIMHLAPGTPVDLYVRPDVPPHVIDNIREQLGFNKPVWQQYVIWIKELISGNFGFSFIHQQSIGSLLRDTIPNTLILTVTVFIVQFIAGILLGVISALKKGRPADHIINSLLLFFYAMPGFWLAIILVLIFSLKLGWLPSGQMTSLHDIEGFWAQLWDYIRHLILPVFVLSIPFIAYTTRFVRDNLCDILEQPYILTAKAYGLGKRKILFQYALKNALLPLVTLIGLHLPFLLGGAVITEYIFAWPGMGRLTVEAVFTHDYPLIMATNLIAATAVVFGNMISDLLYKWVDPRIRLAEKL